MSGSSPDSDGKLDERTVLLSQLQPLRSSIVKLTSGGERWAVRHVPELLLRVQSSLQMLRDVRQDLAFSSGEGEEAWLACQGVPSDVAELPEKEIEKGGDELAFCMAERDVLVCLRALDALQQLLGAQIGLGILERCSCILDEIERVLVHMEQHLEYDILDS